MLPTQKTKKHTSPFDYITLVYGEPKIGKSSACARISDAVFIPTEPGIKNLSVYATDVPDTWQDFRNIAGELKKGDHQFKVVVIDTIDGMYQLCAEHVCKENSWQHESDLDYGKGYARVKQELMRVLKKLAALPLGLVLVGHSKEKEVKTRTGSFDRVTLCFSGSIEEAITAFVDVALYCHVEDRDDEKIRVVRSLGTNEYFAGGRVNFFEDGMLLENLFKKGDKK